MGIEFLFDIVKLGLFVACAQAALAAYALRRRPAWARPLGRRRLAVLALLTLAFSAIKLIEDVVARESGPVDEAILWFIRDHMPAAVTGWLSVLTLSGSAAFLGPASGVAALALWMARRRFEAALLAGSTGAASLVIYVLKSLVDRDRPALWDTQWYWGSSFPSGHTLGTAAVSTAGALCLARLWPPSGTLAMAVAAAWTLLVALSRLVLGVHWPTDVLAAMCLGAFIPLSISVTHDLHPRGTGAGT